MEGIMWSILTPRVMEGYDLSVYFLSTFLQSS